MIIEDCINIGNHIISGLPFRIAGTFKDVFKVLEENEVISSPTSKIMQDFVEFRNKLVHVYWRIEEKETLEKIEKIKKVEEYVKEVYNFLVSKGFLSEKKSS